MNARVGDIARFSWQALVGYPGRTVLMLIAMAIGVASVVVLTALGEGSRRYVAGEFASLGTNLLIVLPGRSETAGFSPANLMSETPRDLTVDDALALARHVGVRRVAPINVGAAQVSWRQRSRETVILGASHDLNAIRRWRMGQGRFLPAGDLDRASPVAVIGATIRDELFGAERAVGQWIRIGDRRFRVIGVMGTKGRSIGVDVQETVIIPVAAAQQLFNTSSLLRILVEARNREAIDSVQVAVVDILQARHQGVRDVTVITQDAVLATFDRVLAALTYGLAGIAAISLAVAGILIMNVMLVAVSQRTPEISLLKALGASPAQILVLILAEALLLSVMGSACGLALGQTGAVVIRQLVPDLPAYTPWWALLMAPLVAIGAGALFSLLPARRAARLDPVQGLSRR